MTRRQILITKDDMARLRELVSRGGVAFRRDQEHLKELERELERAEVVTAEDVPPDAVTMHSTVSVRDLDTDTSVIYTIVFPVEADIATKRISVLAPVGTALIGYRAGDVIEWATPGGTRRLRIDAVLFQPEAAAGERWEPSVAHDSRQGAAIRMLTEIS
ncbi:MAG: nucleoside diphosphate kinase regulator [Candidatus Rokuibacteriota bacterium]